MQMPLVSKFLCYLEAEARRELAGSPSVGSPLPSIPSMDVSMERKELGIAWIPLEGTQDLLSFPPHPLFVKAIHSSCIHRRKIPKQHSLQGWRQEDANATGFKVSLALTQWAPTMPVAVYVSRFEVSERIIRNSNKKASDIE